LAPPEGWVNLNIDASFLVTTGENFSEAIIRDHSGRVLLSSYNINKKCATVEEAEAEACYEGIKQAAE
jgi:hypothetical protein